MVPRSKTHFLALLGALLAVLMFAAESPAQQKKKSPPPNKKPPQPSPQQVLNSRVAEQLRQAYILMAGANHDYNGHRVRAMHQIEMAVRILDKNIFKNGTHGQKVLALQEEIAVARAKLAAANDAAVHERQALSDLQMKLALKAIVHVRPAMVQTKQGNVVRHLDEARKQIVLALKVN